MSAMLDLIRRHKSGVPVGIYSVCSAHPLVLEAALRLAQRTEGVALIEATSNQVNQDGGYTGMRPAAFRERVLDLASAVGLPHDRVLLGGDHLGPNCWQRLPASTALDKAGVMVTEYVAAGFRKITLVPLDAPLGSGSLEAKAISRLWSEALFGARLPIHAE